VTSTVLAAPLPEIDVPQYSKARVLAVWAAAALPMGILAWVVAPFMASRGVGLIPALIGCLTAGLIWQFVLVLLLNGFSLRGLWLRAPSTSDGRRGGRLWLWVVPFVLGFGALQLIPLSLPAVASHDFGTFLSSDEGQTFLRGDWGIFAIIAVMFLFNTVLGEELLFRGLLLPRMRAAFGRADWVANGALFGLYHLHQPWSIPSSIIAGLLMAYPTRRFRSAWFGIIVHSAQSVVLTAIIFTLVTAP
jgi:membrane protease YdiL (CAAX protease family)